MTAVIHWFSHVVLKNVYILINTYGDVVVGRFGEGSDSSLHSQQRQNIKVQMQFAANSSTSEACCTGTMLLWNQSECLRLCCLSIRNAVIENAGCYFFVSLWGLLTPKAVYVGYRYLMAHNCKSPTYCVNTYVITVKYFYLLECWVVTKYEYKLKGNFQDSKPFGVYQKND